MSTRNLEFFKELDYKIIIEKQELDNEYWFIAYANELGKFACYGKGESQSEALENFVIEKNEFIEFLFKEDKEIPLPNIQDETSKFSGFFNVRTSPTIHASLVYQAKELDISLNLYVNQLLSGMVEKKNQENIILDKLTALSGQLEAHHFEITKQLRYQQNKLSGINEWAKDYCPNIYLKTA